MGKLKPQKEFPNSIELIKWALLWKHFLTAYINPFLYSIPRMERLAKILISI